MERRNLGAGLAVLASSFMLLGGVASAHGVAAGTSTTATGCTVKSLPSFVAQGEYGYTASIADVVEISCDPYTYGTGQEVSVTASQLASRCHNLAWIVPNNSYDEPEVQVGQTVHLNLDADGNATASLIAGPDCMPGESLITLDENESPYETFTTSFMVTPPANTTQGVYALPSSQVEDSGSSSVTTVVEAEFKGGGEKYVRLASEQLNDRCHDGGLVWVPGYVTEYLNEDYSVASIKKAEDGYSGENETEIRLDDNGNGFAVAVGIDSCLEGTSLIEADLVESPFTTETTNFTVVAPKAERFG
jgi:hypothetical protein